MPICSSRLYALPSHICFHGIMSHMRLHESTVKSAEKKHLENMANNLSGAHRLCHLFAQRHFECESHHHRECGTGFSWPAMPYAARSKPISLFRIRNTKHEYLCHTFDRILIRNETPLSIFDSNSIDMLLLVAGHSHLYGI